MANKAIPGFGEIAEQLRRSTVLIQSGGRGSGTGVIWSSEGLLVTNAHVIHAARPKVRLALAIPSNAVRDFLSAGPAHGRLGVTVHPALIPRPGPRNKAFGLVILEVEPDSPAAQASLLPGDILLGTEDKPFASLEDLARSLRGTGPRALRVEFLRGDYTRVRRVTVQLGNPLPARSSVAA